MLDLMVSADVAELADAQVSEACGVTPVEVRVLSSAPKIYPSLFHQISEPEICNEMKTLIWRTVEKSQAGRPELQIFY